MYYSSRARFVRNKTKSKARQYRPMGINRNEIRGYFEFERASVFFYSPCTTDKQPKRNIKNSDDPRINLSNRFSALSFEENDKSDRDAVGSKDTEQ